jgi:hypothetical protein
VDALRLGKPLEVVLVGAQAQGVEAVVTGQAVWEEERGGKGVYCQL